MRSGGRGLKSEIAYGYKVKGHDYLVFDKKEIDSAKPISTKLIELDRFVNFFQVDPHYFERTFLLTQDNSEKPLPSLESPKEDLAQCELRRLKPAVASNLGQQFELNRAFSVRQGCSLSRDSY